MKKLLFLTSVLCVATLAYAQRKSGNETIVVTQDGTEVTVVDTTTTQTISGTKTFVTINLPNGSVSGGTGGVITDATITAADLAANSVTNSEMADNAIGNAELAGNAVTSDKIANETIVSADIDNGSILGADIASETITGSNIDNGTITNADISSSAAISGTKINPNFGAQTIEGGGTIFTTVNISDDLDFGVASIIAVSASSGTTCNSSCSSISGGQWACIAAKQVGVFSSTSCGTSSSTRRCLCFSEDNL